MMKKCITAIVPAAGVGRRMLADRPKQYLMIAGKTILEHTVEALLSHDDIAQVVIAVSEGDPYFAALPLIHDERVLVASGGAERADSVQSALKLVSHDGWILVHDAARPCLSQKDLTQLIEVATATDQGALLATPVRDTMKRGTSDGVEATVDRVNLWHALTPQMCTVSMLRTSLDSALLSGAVITDEASALEFCGYKPKLVLGRADNNKVTQPEDLALAAFYLHQRGE